MRIVGWDKLACVRTVQKGGGQKGLFGLCVLF